MMTASAARILAGKYNEPFKAVLIEIKDAALAKHLDLKLNLQYHTWLNELGFEKFKEVMSALGFKVYKNENDFRVTW